MKLKIIVVFYLLLLFITIGNGQVLVETESFDNKGGWLLDHQAFEKIASTYLIANGMGVPVEDASTSVSFKKADTYYVYVHTYNWTAPWYDGNGPGGFQLRINGEALPNVLGNTGKEWEWQFAGKVQVKEENTMALHDLSGFNGRADAIYFSKRKSELPTGFEDLNQFRKEKLGLENLVKAPEVDLVVVGAGVAGCAAALTAAREGVRVALVDNLPKLGGNNYLGVGLSGFMHYNLYPRLGDIVRELSGIPYHEDTRKIPHLERDEDTGYPLERKTGKQMAQIREDMLIKAGVLIFHNTHVYKAHAQNGKIRSLTGKNLLTNEDILFKGKIFADCTGDGTVGFLAGADFRIGRESRSVANESLAPESPDQKKMGSTVKWSASNTRSAASFPRFKKIPWAIECTDDYFCDVTGNRWWWETGFELNNAEESELIRDNALRAIYGNWSYLHNNLDKYSSFALRHVDHIAMKRESRRLLGDIIVNENDFRNQVKYPDASFTATWPFDLHYATPENTKYYPGWEWQSYCDNGSQNTMIEPYHLPYRSLYSRNVNNLFMAGRCISVTHVALGSVRVQVTTGMMGEVVGMASKICIDNKTLPRGVYEKYLNELKKLMQDGPQL